MIRTCIASVLCLSGLASVASAQVFTGYDSSAYTSYYRAPASYSNYGYSSNGYRGGWGPLGLVNWGWTAGRPAYSGSYTAGYAPSSYVPATTSYYAPTTTSFYAPSTSYYAPVTDTTLAYYSAPVASNSCCTPCCSSCSSGNCPGGNCSMNYAPADMSPRPDPASSGSRAPDPASSGSRTIENESNGSRSTDPGTQQKDDWRRPADGYGGTERGAGYSPQTKIEKKAPPTEVNDGSAADSADQAEPEAEETFEAPGNDPAASLLDMDTKVTATSGIVPERLSLKARFQSPRLARSIVKPQTFPTTDEFRLVRK